MEVYLRKDVPKIGLAGQIIKVKPGFANNFIVPRGLGVIVTDDNRDYFKQREKKPKDQDAVSAETSMLAEKIGSLKLVLKRKLHDDGKLYASIRPAEVVDLIAEKGIKIEKSQVKFTRPIKEKGSFNVIIKLSTKLQPQVTLNVISE